MFPENKKKLYGAYQGKEEYIYMIFEYEARKKMCCLVVCVFLCTQDR